MKKLILQLLLLTVACLYCSASMVDLLRVRLGKLPEQDFARIEATDFGDALVVSVPENRKQGSHWIVMKQLDLKPFRGKKLLFTVFAKGEIPSGTDAVAVKFSDNYQNSKTVDSIRI